MKLFGSIKQTRIKEKLFVHRTICKKLQALNDRSMTTHQLNFIAPKFYPVDYKRKKGKKVKQNIWRKISCLEHDLNLDKAKSCTEHLIEPINSIKIKDKNINIQNKV